MKNIKILAIGAALTLGLASCGDSYFNVDLEQNIKTESAYSNAQDVQNGMIGAFYQLGTYQFYGRDVVALGDMASDLAIASSRSGHFLTIYQYNIVDTDGDLEDIWSSGYSVLDKCTRTIQGGKAVLDKTEELKLSEDEEITVNMAIAECYALRALATFTMTNIFGLPYQAGTTNSQLGIALLVNEPLQPFVNTKRSTVEECYAQVLSDIATAKEYYIDDSVLPGETGFFMNASAIFALEARVNLYMGKYKEAQEAAATSLSLLKNGDNYDLPSDDIYSSMWSSIAINDETIFAISKTDDDNLSANALNTLYGSYYGAPTEALQALFNITDVRKTLQITFGSTTYAYKWQGTSTSHAVSNIPVFRKSEMYLIIAECAAQLGNIDEAKDALFYTAKRDAAIESVDDLPATKDELLSFIADERARELCLEGHRWFDARRTGVKLDVVNGAHNEFDVAKFVYPIPASEINAGFGIVQNEGWSDNLPQ